MWSQKIKPNFLLILFLVFSNFWILRILKQNLLLGLIVATASIAAALFSKSKQGVIGLLICFTILSIFQYQTTEISGLTVLSNDEQRVQSERIHLYPLTYINLFFKVVWLKPDIWIEKNSNVIALSRIEKNLFEILDINKYFFWSHSKEYTIGF